jgi:hypothetical protein
VTWHLYKLLIDSEIIKDCVQFIMKKSSLVILQVSSSCRPNIHVYIFVLPVTASCSFLRSAYVSIRQHTSAYVSIRQHTSASSSIRQHTSAYVSVRQRTSAYVSIRQHTPAYVSIRQHLPVAHLTGVSLELTDDESGGASAARR